MPTKIEWAQETWNPITGCSPISEGCEHCYAARMAKRLRGRCGYDRALPFKVTFHEDQLAKPYFWKKPRMIFVCSMGDLFHKDVHSDWIDDVFTVMKLASHHIFLILTKRPERMKEYLSNAPWNLPNVWLGVTAENQQRADERIPVLLDTPARVRFVSVEPMLEPVDLNKKECICSTWRKGHTIGTYLDWVICGGETGPGSRPMHPDWVRTLQYDCQEAKVPFFFKSWGDWRAAGDHYDTEHCKLLNRKTGTLVPVVGGWGAWQDAEDWECVRNFGKKKAGRELDGRTWDEYPNDSR